MIDIMMDQQNFFEKKIKFPEICNCETIVLTVLGDVKEESAESDF